MARKGRNQIAALLVSKCVLSCPFYILERWVVSESAAPSRSFLLPPSVIHSPIRHRVYTVTVRDRPPYL